jgi:hypothetical protein
MRKVVISGREYAVTPTLGKIDKLLRTAGNYKSSLDFLVTAVWVFLKPRFLWIKPFVFKHRLANRIDVDEIEALDVMCKDILDTLKVNVEGRDQGNPTQSQKKNTS